MSKLMNFLIENSVEELTEEVPVGERFKDNEGNLLKFKIKAVPSDEFATLQKQCTVTRKKGKVEFDSKSLMNKLLLTTQ